eukprot:3105348-Rhodomonas_salina.1
MLLHNPVRVSRRWVRARARACQWHSRCFKLPRRSLALTRRLGLASHVSVPAGGGRGRGDSVFESRTPLAEPHELAFQSLPGHTQKQKQRQRPASQPRDDAVGVTRAVGGHAGANPLSSLQADVGVQQLAVLRQP